MEETGAMRGEKLLTRAGWRFDAAVRSLLLGHRRPFDAAVRSLPLGHRRLWGAFLLAALALSCDFSESNIRVYPEGTVIEDGIITNESIGLVLGLSFDENIDSSSTVAIVGAKWTSGFEDTGLEFNGYFSTFRKPVDG